MSLRVGDEFLWNRKGSILKVTKIRDGMVKFEIVCSVPISGSMCLDLFLEKFQPKSRRLAA